MGQRFQEVCHTPAPTQIPLPSWLPQFTFKSGLLRSRAGPGWKRWPHAWSMTHIYTALMIPMMFHRWTSSQSGGRWLQAHVREQNSTQCSSQWWRTTTYSWLAVTSTLRNGENYDGIVNHEQFSLQNCKIHKIAKFQGVSWSYFPFTFHMKWKAGVWKFCGCSEEQY